MGLAFSKECSRAPSSCSHLHTLSGHTVQGICLDSDMHTLINLTILTKLALLSPLQRGGNRGSWLSVYRSNQQPEERVENDFTEGKERDSHKGIKGHRRRIRQGLRSVLCIWQYEGHWHVHLSQHLQFGTRHTVSATKSKFRCEIEPDLTQEKMGLKETGVPILTDQGWCCSAMFLPYFLSLTKKKKNLLQDRQQEQRTVLKALVLFISKDMLTGLRISLISKISIHIQSVVSSLVYNLPCTSPSSKPCGSLL